MAIPTLDAIGRAFGGVVRPKHFHDASHCEECAEHEATLLAHTPESIGLEQVGNAGWDPICGISEEGYHYFMPALARLAFGRGENYYLGQFLFHLSPDRIARFTPEQRQAILRLLEHIREEMEDEAANQGDMEILERRHRRLRAQQT